MDKVALFVNIVPWRPHGEHAGFIAQSMLSEGWVVKAARCGGGLNNCYQKLVNGRFFECQGCQYESLSSFEVFDQVDSLKFDGEDCEKKGEEAHWSVLSSVGTAYRIELDSEMYSSAMIDKVSAVQSEFEVQVKSWTTYLKNNPVDLVVLFNGRFHDTAAVICACEALDVRYVTHERSWFGSGLQLNSQDDCISLKPVSKLVQKSLSVSLDGTQIEKAYSLVASRLSGTNNGEWRKYGQVHKDKGDKVWPCPKKGRRILIIPSSRSEFIGHPDYKIDFETTISCLEYFLKRNKLNNDSIVLRCHPAWEHAIGKHSISKSYAAYRDWAERNGILLIEPSSQISTYSLMELADFAVFNGGSAVVEGALLGCPAVTLSPSPYVSAGFVVDCSTKEKIDSTKLVFPGEEELFIYALRYVYARAFMQPFFINSMFGVGAKKYKYVFDERDFGEVERMLSPDELEVSSLVAGFSQGERVLFQNHRNGSFVKSNATSEGSSEDKAFEVPRKSKVKRLGSFF